MTFFFNDTASTEFYTYCHTPSLHDALPISSRAGAMGEDRAMNQLAPLPAPAPALALPALIAAADERAQLRFLEFFAVTIRNPHTRRAYARAAGDFLAWCEARGVDRKSTRLNSSH